MNRDHQIAAAAHAICSADGEESFNKIIIQTCNSKGEITGGILTPDEGRSYISGNDSLLLKYDTDTIGGNSSSPVYTMTKQTISGKVSYVYTALAIHSGAGDRVNPDADDGPPIYLYNKGARMTKYLTQFYSENLNIGW